MSIRIYGEDQNAAQQAELTELTKRLNELASDARKLTTTARSVLTYVNALGYSDQIGAAGGDEYLTDVEGRPGRGGVRARTVAKVRIMLKVAVSFAVIKGEVDPGTADGILQELYGNDTEVHAGPDELIDLVEDWI